MSNYKKLKFDGAQMDALLSLVEQGGSGGNGGGSEESAWAYYDFSSLGMSLSSDVLTSMSMQVTLIKVAKSNGNIVIGNVFWIIGNIESEDYSSYQIMAVGFDEGLKCVFGDDAMTVGEFFKQMGDPFSQLPRLTKEEFYNI